MGRRRLLLLSFVALALLLLLVIYILPDRNSKGGHVVRDEPRDPTDVEPALRGAAHPPEADLDRASIRRAAQRADAAGLFPPASKADITAHLRELADPTEPANTDSLPPYEDVIMEMRAVFHRAYRSVRALAEAGASSAVDEALLAIGRTHTAWDSRCRATLALVRRQDRRAATLLSDLVRSKEPYVRYVAWDIATEAAGTRHARPPIAAEFSVKQYAQEQEEEVAEMVAAYLGAIRAKGAVPLLVERARTSDQAASALGLLGAKEAVAVLIEANAYWALARIGTPAAMTHLLENLDKYGAVEAIAESGDRSVLPALEGALAKMRTVPRDQRRPGSDHSIRLAIAQLRSNDPCTALMDLIEDPRSEDELRVSAAATLRMSHGRALHAKHQERLAGIYVREESPGVREQCNMVLEDSTAPGVTEAMLHHALAWKPHMKTYSPSQLLAGLNRRLGSSFETIDDVGRYVRLHGMR